MPDYNCSACRSRLREKGRLPIAVIEQYEKARAYNAFFPEAPMLDIRDDPFVYEGFFCTSCRMVFCLKCLNMQGEICPKCGGRTLLAALRPYLKEAGLGVETSTSSEGQKDVVLQMVRPFLKTCELMVSIGKGSDPVTASAPELIKAWESLLSAAQIQKPTDENLRALQLPSNPTWSDALSAGRAIESAFSSGKSKKWWQFW